MFARISAGLRKHDLNLRPRELRLLEEEITKEAMEGGNGFALCQGGLMSSDCVELPFEVLVGDAGEVCEASTPYEIRDGAGCFDDDFVEL